MVASTDNIHMFAQTAPSTNITIRSNYIAYSGRTGMWIGELDSGLLQNNVIVRQNRHPKLPHHGVSAEARRQLEADAKQAIVTRVSVTVNEVNNLTLGESTLIGAVSLNRTSASLPAEPSTGSIIVQSNVPGLEWSALSDSDWIAIASKKMARALSGARALNQQQIIGCLVHVHAVIDLGGKDHESRVDKSGSIGVALRKVWESQYQVRIDNLYENRDVGTSLTHIARYIVKGGNEKLRYHFGYGREGTEDSMNRLIAKKGRLSREEIEEGGKDTELALSHHEIDVLDSAYASLMDSKNSNWRDGYKFVHGQEIRHLKK